MNEHIREVWLKAAREDSGDKWDSQTEFIERFAKLIVRECCDIFVELRTRPADLAVKDVKKHFGVEEFQGWVCPKCGVDRTKASCPQGHMAAVEGKCPMIGVAQ